MGNLLPFLENIQLFITKFFLVVFFAFLSQDPLNPTESESATLATSLQPVLRIRDVYPGSYFFPSGSRIPIFSIPDPTSKNLNILTQKNGF
jgi:hypothetical protein